MPVQPLLSARRPRAVSEPATQASPEASEVGLLMHLFRLCLFWLLKRARQYDLPPSANSTHLQPPLQPPSLPASSSSLAHYRCPILLHLLEILVTKSNSKMMTRSACWIQSILLILMRLFFYLLQTSSSLLLWSAVRVDLTVELIARFLKLPLVRILTTFQMCHNGMDKRDLRLRWNNLQFLVGLLRQHARTELARKRLSKN